MPLYTPSTSSGKEDRCSNALISSIRKCLPCAPSNFPAFCNRVKMLYLTLLEHKKASSTLDFNGPRLRATR